jgi:hypothetical protein
MKIALSPALESMLKDVMRRGDYDDPETAIASGLHSWGNDEWRFNDWWESLGEDRQREFEESLDCAAEGPFTEVTPEFIESLRQRVRDRAAGRHLD